MKDQTLHVGPVLPIPLCCSGFVGQHLMISLPDCSVSVRKHKKTRKKLVPCALIDHCELFLGVSAFGFITKH